MRPFLQKRLYTRSFDRDTSASLGTHHTVGPDSKTTQRPRRRTKPPQYSNLIIVYRHLLLRFPQRDVQDRFIGRVGLSA